MGRKTLSVDEVAGKILSKERRMKSVESMSTNSTMTIKSRTHANKNHKKKLVCLKCGKSGHLKKHCLNGGTSRKGELD